jgi:hypothetical protein
MATRSPCSIWGRSESCAGPLSPRAILWPRSDQAVSPSWQGRTSISGFGSLPIRTATLTRSGSSRPRASPRLHPRQPRPQALLRSRPLRHLRRRLRPGRRPLLRNQSPIGHLTRSLMRRLLLKGTVWPGLRTSASPRAVAHACTLIASRLGVLRAYWTVLALREGLRSVRMQGCRPTRNRLEATRVLRRGQRAAARRGPSRHTEKAKSGSGSSCRRSPPPRLPSC